MRLKFININFIPLFIKLDLLNKPFSKFAVFLFFIFLSKWGQVFSQASFTTSPASINNTLTLCSGSQVLFTNTLVGVNSINWTFEGGSPASSNALGPHIVTFANSGTFTVSLSVNGSALTTMQVVIQASSTSSNLNLLLDNACVSGSGFGSSTFNDVTYFTSCANSFQGDNICLYTTTTLTNNNSIHNIFWGDGTSNVYTGSNIPSNQLAFQHYYQNTGASFITYTLQESNNSCVRSKIYPLYTGANPTAVISPGGVPTLCNPGSVNYNIIPGTQNTIGTIYTISVNDAGGGSNTSYTFNHPPPASLNHLFNSVSCGTTSVINSNTYQNSFQVSISSSNACGSSSSAIGPINIQSAPDAIVSTTPSLATYNNKVCQFSNVTFNDISTPGTNINVQGNANANPPIPPYSCNNIYKKIWRLYGPLGLITMSNAYATILSGSLGTSQSLSSANSWFSGSTNVDVQFLLPGNYKMTLYVGAQNNPCGIDSTWTNICVTPDFQVNITSPFVTACAPANGIFENNSTPAQCNLNNVSAWTVTPSNPQNCGQPAWSYNNNTNAQSLNASVAFTGPGVYTVQLQNSLNSPVFSNTTPLGCQPKTTTAQVTIKAAPMVSITPPVTICAGASFTPVLSSNVCYGTPPIAYAWNFNPNNTIPLTSQPNPLSSNLQNPGPIIYPTDGTFPFSVSATNECGTTTANSTIVVKPLPVATVPATVGPICSGSNAVITVSSTINPTTFSWYSIAPSGVVVTASGILSSGSNTATLTTPIINNTNATQQVMYIFTPTANGCIGVPDTTIVTVQPVATVGPFSPIVVCPGVTISPSTFVSNPIGATFSWVNSNTLIGLGASGTGNITPWAAPANNTNTSIIGTISVTPTFNGCTGTVSNFLITIKPTPAVTNNPSGQAICSGFATTAVLWTSGVVGTTYAWTAIGSSGSVVGFTTSGTGNLPILTGITNSSNINQTITYSVTPSALGCSGPVFQYVITVKPIPALTLSPNQTVCGGIPTAITNFSNTIAAGSYSWVLSNPGAVPATITGYQTNGSGQIPVTTIGNSGTSPYTLSYQVTPTASGCNGIPQTYTFTINPAPTAQFSIVNQSICTG